MRTEGNLFPSLKWVTLFFFIVLSGTLSFADCTGKTKKDDMNKKSEITGVLTLEPNPCLTKPCLPGMVLALKSEKAVYFLKNDGNFIEENFKWRGVPLKQDDVLVIKGKKSDLTDIFDKPFTVLEIDSVSLKK